MGLVADIREVVKILEQKVLQRVSQEATLDVDIEVNYAEMSDQVMTMGLAVPTGADEAVSEQTRLVNDALRELGDVLGRIEVQLNRAHKDDEFARLYEQEKRRYISSSTSKRARRKFQEWKDYTCYGHPLFENIEDYRVEKLVHMFEQGVFDEKVKHIQRAKRYSGEVDFVQLDDDHRLKKTIHKYYHELRKLVDYVDGKLVVDPIRVGRYFYASRHEENAKQRRNAFLKYMHKIDMAQALLEKLQEAEQEVGAESNPQLNYFAPAKHLKVLLQEEWFELHRTDKRYDQRWTDNFVSALMNSEHKDYIAREWSKDNRQDYLRGCILGLLKEGGVVKGSMDSIARSAGVCENYRTFSKYMGHCQQEPYAEWVLGYLRE
jgi:hypothetical protein